MNHMGQAKSGSGTTMALHECAAMRGEGTQLQDAYFESAWLLMSAGASPFAERSDGGLKAVALNDHVPLKCASTWLPFVVPLERSLRETKES